MNEMHLILSVNIRCEIYFTFKLVECWYKYKNAYRRHVATMILNKNLLFGTFGKIVISALSLFTRELNYSAMSKFILLNQIGIFIKSIAYVWCR